MRRRRERRRPQARITSALRAILVGLAAAAAMTARGIMGVVAPGVEARFSVLYPATLLATLTAALA